MGDGELVGFRMADEARRTACGTAPAAGEGVGEAVATESGNGAERWNRESYSHAGRRLSRGRRLRRVPFPVVAGKPGAGAIDDGGVTADFGRERAL